MKAMWLFFLLLPFQVLAQDESSDAEIDRVEAEIKKGQIRKSEPNPRKDVAVESVIDLSKLAPASDVSVIQKRFMPKTGRLQLNGGLSVLTNDPWFSGQGFQGRLGYGFSEAWAVEVEAMLLSTWSRDSVRDLANSLAVNTSSLVSTKNYFGGHIMWTPFYGKLSLWDEKIVPFDMYLTAGGGNSGLSSDTVSSAATIHVGLGQIYSLSKSLGLRWDLSVNTFSIPSGRFYNVLLNVGVSYYIPEVSSR